MNLSGDVLWEDSGAPAREVLRRSGKETIVHAPRHYTVPSALHPAHIERYFVRDPKTGDEVSDPVLGAIRDVMGRMSEVARSMIATRAAVLDNRAETIGRRTIQNAQKMHEMAHAMAPAIDRAREQASRVIAFRESEMALPEPRDAREQIAQMEMRQRLAGMPEDERMATIARSDAFMIAALNSDPALSGMHPAKHKLALIQWRKRHHGDKLAHIERLQAADALLGAAADRFMDFAGDLSKHPELEAAGRADRAAKEVLEAKT
jgi:hypothetical protein